MSEPCQPWCLKAKACSRPETDPPDESPRLVGALQNRRALVEELAVAGEILGAEARVAASADPSLDEWRADKEGDADEEEGGDEPVDDEAGDDALLINGVHEAGHEDPGGDGAGDVGGPLAEFVAAGLVRLVERGALGQRA